MSKQHSIYSKVAVDILAQQRDSLLRQAQQLQATHQALQYEQQLLAGYCEGLTLLQLRCAAHELQHHPSTTANTCDSSSSSSSGSSSSDIKPPASEQFVRLLQAEAQLLQQLCAGGGSNSNNSSGVGAAAGEESEAAAPAAAPALAPAPAPPAAAAGSYDLGVETISPISDPMAFTRHLLSLAPDPSAVPLTVLGMAQQFRDSILDISLWLHKSRSSSEAATCSRAQQKIQAAFERATIAALTLLASGGEAVFDAASLYNLETMQPDLEGAQAAAARMPLLLQHLQLTLQQQQVIVIGLKLYQRLLAGIQREGKQLLQQIDGCCRAPEAQEGQQQAAAPAAAPGGFDDDSKGGSVAGTGSGGCLQQKLEVSAQPLRSQSGQQRLLRQDHTPEQQQREPQHMQAMLADVASLTDRLAELEVQQQGATQLRLLLRKEYRLRIIAVHWLLGMLTWDQLATVVVFCWPFRTVYTLLAHEILQQCCPGGS